MSSSSTHSSSGDDSQSSSSSHSNTLLVHRNDIKEHGGTLSNPKDIVSQPEDALPHLEDNLLHSADALLLHEDTLPHLADILSQPENHTMTDTGRSKYRNVHIFNANDRNTTIGGLILTDGVTNANFYAMIEIIVIVTSDFTLRNESDVIIKTDSSPLQPGNYYIHSPQPFDLSNELVLCRALSIQTGTRVQAFRDTVRLRDRRCVITGKVYLDDDNWRGFEASHIFPLAYEQHWTDYNYGRWISIMPDKGGAINSVQNGLLLRGDIHTLFNFYDFSINPDDNYKIVCFTRDGNGIAGKYLDQRFLDNPQRPADQLLRWHFRQAVLTNMKGAGEPILEHDFPPGSDIMGEIVKGPKAAERMEFELFSRMSTQFDLVE